MFSKYCNSAVNSFHFSHSSTINHSYRTFHGTLKNKTPTVYYNLRLYGFQGDLIKYSEAFTIHRGYTSIDLDLLGKLMHNTGRFSEYRNHFLHPTKVSFELLKPKVHGAMKRFKFHI